MNQYFIEGLIIGLEKDASDSKWEYSALGAGLGALPGLGYMAVQKLRDKPINAGIATGLTMVGSGIGGLIGAMKMPTFTGAIQMPATGYRVKLPEANPDKAKSRQIEDKKIIDLSRDIANLTTQRIEADNAGDSELSTKLDSQIRSLNQQSVNLRRQR